jgi:site-specific recombinase XerC
MRWANHKTQHGCINANSIIPRRCENFIRYANLWLRFLGRIQVPKKPVITQISEFAEYMRNEKCLSEVTIFNHCFQLEKFFNQIKEEPSQFLTHLKPAYLDDLIIHKINQGVYARSTICFFASTMRNFFRYAEYRGWCQSGLANSMHFPRVYKYQTLPSSPSWEDVQRLLKTVRHQRLLDTLT